MTLRGPCLGGPMRMTRGGGSMTMSGETCGMPLGEVAGGAPRSGVLLHDISQCAAEPVSGLCTYLPDRATSHGQDAGGVRMALPPDQVANAGLTQAAPSSFGTRPTNRTGRSVSPRRPASPHGFTHRGSIRHWRVWSRPGTGSSCGRWVSWERPEGLDRACEKLFYNSQ